MNWQSQNHDRAIPLLLWHYAFIFIAEVQSIIAHAPNKCPRVEPILGPIINISEMLDFKIYDLDWYWDQPELDMTTTQSNLGQCLGIAHLIWTDMT